MTIEEIVKMPEPMVFQPPGFGGDGSYTADQLRAYGEAVAGAVARGCADLCESKAGTSEYDDSTSRYLAQDIRREFGEVSNG